MWRFKNIQERATQNTFNKVFSERKPFKLKRGILLKRGPFQKILLKPTSSKHKNKTLLKSKTHKTREKGGKDDMRENFGQKHLYWSRGQTSIRKSGGKLGIWKFWETPPPYLFTFCCCLLCSGVYSLFMLCTACIGRIWPFC